jgi:hypothetical protein
MIVETVLAVGISALSLPARKSSCGYLTNEDGTRKSFSICNGPTLEQQLGEEFEAIPGVLFAEVRRSVDHIYAEISVSQFDRQTRRAIYARERKIYESFPRLSFEIHIVDASKATADALAG